MISDGRVSTTAIMLLPWEISPAVVDALGAEILFPKINYSGHMIFADVQGIHGKSIAWIGGKVKAGTGWPN